ncbi:hypothetical protein PMIT1323_00326 [Prochlorococcus marinus str. MIT 1323]|nr:hypothetical protein PMIT1323_00326 [Prochlorococcus marinus str. MIT 1323]
MKSLRSDCLLFERILLKSLFMIGEKVMPFDDSINLDQCHDFRCDLELFEPRTCSHSIVT